MKNRKFGGLRYLSTRLAFAFLCNKAHVFIFYFFFLFLLHIIFTQFFFFLVAGTEQVKELDSI